MKKLSSRVVYQNHWMVVREDKIQLADNTESIYGVVEKLDFSIVIPYQDDCVWLVEQFRYVIGERFWEFPMGAADSEKETPEEVALKELREETGLIAGKIEYIGHLFEAYGYSSQRMHVFVAGDLQETGKQQLDVGEQGLITKRFPLSRVKQMLRDGTIRDAASVAAYGLWQLQRQQ